jgi:3-dehydroquinate dehydratase/shikimate dehydrogenase
MAQICVASHHGSLAELTHDAEFLEISRRGDTLIELRLDQYSDLSTANLESTLCAFGPAKLLVTHRSPDEGGRNAGADDTQRFFYLSQATTLGAAFVDVELATIRRNTDAWRTLRAARQRGTQFVVSFHDFKGSPPFERLRTLRREAEEAGADVVKFAVSAATIFDSAPLLDLLSETGWRKPFLGLVMGEAGFWSRVLGPRFPTPAPFTFARGGQAPGTAPGQPTWRELADRYRFPQVQPDTPVYAVIGDPVAQSLSPAMHNSALMEAGLPGLYIPLRVAGDPAAFVRDLAPKLGLRGISVTHPHKEAILPACRDVEALARRIGAANTLAAGHTGAWSATNTDAVAAADLLEEALGGQGALRGKNVLILGAGRIAWTIAFGVKARGAELAICSRTPEQGRKLSAATDGKSVLEEDLKPSLEAAVVVNATPQGMHPQIDETPLEAARIPSGSLVFDAVYNPVETRLLREAQAAGHRVLDGLSLFVAQGALQFELFTGKKAPCERMRRVVQAELLLRSEGVVRQ